LTHTAVCTVGAGQAIAGSGAAGLVVENLSVEVRSRGKCFTVVNDVSLTVPPGAIVGLVGESGSGKTMTALSLIRLLPEAARITSGRVILNGRDVLATSAVELRHIRGSEIGMVFQDPMTSLDPCFTIRQQMVETIRAHRPLTKHQASALATDMLARVGIAHAGERLDDYPYQFSGGMRQRVMLAMALVLEPQLLLADEPTTALDVTIQAQILELIARLRDELRMSVLLITHNLGVVDEVADQVVVMYAGEVVEQGTSATILHDPRHPYTQGLLRSMPRPEKRGCQLEAIPGRVPELGNLPSGCPFHPRCPNRTPVCEVNHPTLRDYHDSHVLRCYNPTPYQ
jgi:oligopeptide/dipeptide ABC transporter ATP-binding protein